ncbi:hypothetical protein LTR49_018021 [Elasticomyces elasticus]|nr:hypothetical protein LTR49_018021 [Elasticomyces elasticus]
MSSPTYFPVTSGYGLTMPSKLQSLTLAHKPDIKINLASRKKVFSTLDTIEGTVTITAPKDIQFESIEIEFLGTSHTFVERLTPPGLQEYCPGNGILKAGKSYYFPFVFVVPQRLLAHVCQHKIHNPTIRDAHLQLPPTFGDPEQAKACDAPDDMAPEMAMVRYGIFATISRAKWQEGEMCRFSLGLRARRLRIVPAVQEQPPLDAAEAKSEYIMRREKMIRKGMLKGKLGSLVMEAAQPQSLHLGSNVKLDCTGVTTMAKVMLRFDPADENAAPPKLGSLAAKLKVTTSFGSTARQQLPSKQASLLDISQGMHTEQLNISSRCVANVKWEKYDPAKPATIERPDSACSTTQLTVGVTPEPSGSYKGKTYYAAYVLVPITLPKNKTFAPTFHSCLISRLYQLKLKLTTYGIGPSMDLKVPIQISAEGTPIEGLLRRNSECESGADTNVEAEDISDFFQSRTVRAPFDGFVGRSRICCQATINEAPPGHSPCAPRRSMDIALQPHHDLV